MFRYMIIYGPDDIFLGTNDERVALSYALDDEYFVVDTLNAQLITSEETDRFTYHPIEEILQ